MRQITGLTPWDRARDLMGIWRPKRSWELDAWADALRSAGSDDAQLIDLFAREAASARAREMGVTRISWYVGAWVTCRELLAVAGAGLLVFSIIALLISREHAGRAGGAWDQPSVEYRVRVPSGRGADRFVENSESVAPAIIAMISNRFHFVDRVFVETIAGDDVGGGAEWRDATTGARAYWFFRCRLSDGGGVLEVWEVDAAAYYDAEYDPPGDGAKEN